jgi:hypothetical protein
MLGFLQKNSRLVIPELSSVKISSHARLRIKQRFDSSQSKEVCQSVKSYFQNQKMIRCLIALDPIQVQHTDLPKKMTGCDVNKHHLKIRKYFCQIEINTDSLLVGFTVEPSHDNTNKIIVFTVFDAKYNDLDAMRWHEYRTLIHLAIAKSKEIVDANEHYNQGRSVHRVSIKIEYQRNKLGKAITDYFLASTGINALPKRNSQVSVETRTTFRKKTMIMTNIKCSEKRYSHLQEIARIIDNSNQNIIKIKVDTRV